MPNYQPVIATPAPQGVSYEVLKDFNYEVLARQEESGVNNFKLYSVDIPAHIQRAGSKRLLEWVTYQVARGSAFGIDYKRTRFPGVWVSTCRKV